MQEKGGPSLNRVAMESLAEEADFKLRPKD